MRPPFPKRAPLSSDDQYTERTRAKAGFWGACVSNTSSEDFSGGTSAASPPFAHAAPLNKNAVKSNIETNFSNIFFILSPPFFYFSSYIKERIKALLIFRNRFCRRILFFSLFFERFPGSAASGSCFEFPAHQGISGLIGLVVKAERV